MDQQLELLELLEPLNPELEQQELTNPHMVELHLDLDMEPQAELASLLQELIEAAPQELLQVTPEVPMVHQVPLEPQLMEVDQEHMELQELELQELQEQVHQVQLDPHIKVHLHTVPHHTDNPELQELPTDNLDQEQPMDNQPPLMDNQPPLMDQDQDRDQEPLMVNQHQEQPMDNQPQHTVNQEPLMANLEPPHH
eukprot:TRINITY_DN1030_c0_g1_i5.p2 TRINITY_DN1030_c0_g1~~TRINITY_DN1030_c0_g1_i5.p2  ORF type:complete len:196 (+),score=28.57 TRINITY_DN1030_c0_g1_i5:147-734(+)